MDKKTRLEIDKQLRILGKSNTHDSLPVEGDFLAYDKHNKLPWLLSGEKDGTRIAKDTFASDLKDAINADKEYCKKHMQMPKITDEQHAKILRLLDQCQSFYEVEALARFVFNDQMIPNSFEFVKERALRLNEILPIYDAWREGYKGKR